MIKRTLFFGNPSYLSVSDYQLVVDFPDNQKSKRTIPIEDLGFVVLEHPQITITSQLLALLNHHNVGVINCDHRHMPSSMLLPLNGHSEQNERFREQLLVSIPLKKNLWQQTIKAKIANQARLLAERGAPIQNMMFWVKEVQVEIKDTTKAEPQHIIGKIFLILRALKEAEKRPHRTTY